MDHLFAAELCREEEQVLEERVGVGVGVEGEGVEEGVTRGSPAVRHRDLDHRVQRGDSASLFVLSH